MPGPFRSSRLVGRSAELGRLVAVVEAARESRGGGVVLSGEAGVGKTRLRHEAERYARAHGMAVLSGHAVEHDTSDPFHPLTEALVRAFLDPPRDPELGPLLPTLATLVPSWAPHDDAGAAPPLVGVAEALLRLLEVVGRGHGVLVVLEDLHWADGETLTVLQHVARHLRDLPVALLLTLREREAPTASRLLQRLADTRAVELIAVRPLTDGDTVELVRSCLGLTPDQAVPTEVTELVVERSDGLPFLVEEMLDGMARAGVLTGTDSEPGLTVLAHPLVPTVPTTVVETIRTRHAALSAQARRVVDAAALLGRRFGWEHLGAITELPDAVVTEALREAADAGLLVVDGGLRFRHALTRDAIRALMLPPERVRLAGRAVDALGDPSDPDLLAELAEAAGRPGLAAAHLLASARAARDRGALLSAGARLDRAAALPSDLGLEIRVARAEVHALAGDVDRALAVGLPALDALRSCGDAAREADVRLAIARAALGAGRYDDAARHADEAAELLAPRDPAALLAARAVRAEVAVAAGEPELAARLASDVLGEAPDDGAHADTRCAALEVLGRCYRLSDVGRAEAAFDTALATAARYRLPVRSARALQELGTIDLFDSLRTDRLVAARRAAVEIGAPATEAVADLHLSAALLSRGEVDEGRAAAQRAVRLSRRLGLATVAPALAMLARSHAQDRDESAMEAALAELAEQAPGDDAAQAAGWSHARALLALHEADRAGALAALDRAADLLRSVPGEHDPHRGLWALLATVEGDGESARTEARQAAGSGTRYNRALVAAADAVAAGRSGDGGAGRAFEAAVDEVAGYHSSAWMVHMVPWIAAPAAARDGWGEPVRWLDGAVRWFTSHADPRTARRYEALGTDCRVLLRALGAQVPRRGRGWAPVPAALRDRHVTSREVDVLTLLGDRLTNREIAARLVLSPRTVEKHVASLLAKTGRPDRTALARLARELALPSTPDGGLGPRNVGGRGA